MPAIDFPNGQKAQGDTNGALFTRLKDALGNFITKSNRAQIAISDEALPMAVRNDDNNVFLRGDRNGNIIIGNYDPEVFDQYEGATVNVQKWTPSNTTFAPTQATLTGYNFNPTNLTTANAVAILLGQRYMYKISRVPMQLKKRKRHALVANSFADFGWGVPSGVTTTVPTGACIRITGSNNISVAITYNNVLVAESNIKSKTDANGNTVGGNLDMSSSYYTAGYYVYDLMVDDDGITVTVQDASTGELIGSVSLPVDKAVLRMWSATALPIYDRLINTGTPTTAPIYIDSYVMAVNTDMNISRDASQIASQLGMTSGRNPYTGAPLTVKANSAIGAAAALSNTAASYAQLDTPFLFTTVAGAETDYCLIGFQVPAGLRFVYEGIMIDSVNIGAAVASAPTILEWSLGFNGSAVSLATANIIRKYVGMQSFVVGAPIGQKAERIESIAQSGEITESGRWVTLALKMPQGAATASQQIRGCINIRGRFI